MGTSWANWEHVTKIVDPTTDTIEHDGKTQTVDLIGLTVPESGTVHKRELQTTKSQLDYSVVTVVTDPKIASDSDGHYRRMSLPAIGSTTPSCSGRAMHGWQTASSASEQSLSESNRRLSKVDTAFGTRMHDSGDDGMKIFIL
ncbi:hypothetical protein SAMN05421858_3362 [Haladaptatus litoreus]|uniref:Uncharacterized protein n=1 Tax=Haladaptatus litoreus TaxID=553468 RepID=A0A1N7CZN7_9EURY|nr:hypothetical protein SAMN05421858_3362 [Haladaptatus litoreus]